jgi:agmatinase
MSNNESIDRLNLAFGGLVSFMRSPICTDLEKLDADVAVLGVPTDDGTGWLPGSRFGPRRLREMSLRFASGVGGSGGGFWNMDDNREYLDEEMKGSRIVDCGDVDVIYTRPDLTANNVTKAVRTMLSRGAMPVILGGDHAIPIPIVQAFDQIEGPITVIQFDSHLDYQPFDHGVTLSHGNSMRSIRAMPHVDRIIHAGIRSFRTAKSHYIDTLADNNVVLTTKNMQETNGACLSDVLPKGGKVYVTIDIDSLDLPLVPGTGCPEPSGLSYEELRSALLMVADQCEVVGFDMVEVNPMLDVPSQATSFIAVQLIVEFLGRCRASKAANLNS